MNFNNGEKICVQKENPYKTVGAVVRAKPEQVSGISIDPTLSQNHAKSTIPGQILSQESRLGRLTYWLSDFMKVRILLRTDTRPDFGSCQVGGS